MKLCVQCRYYRRNFFWFFDDEDECWHPDNTRTEPVRGKTVFNVYARQFRSSQCKGELWEAKGNKQSEAEK